MTLIRLAVVLITVITAASASHAGKADTMKALHDVLLDPFNDAKFSAYERTLPRDGDYYVVEGDIRLTERQLRVYVVARSQAPVAAKRSTELIVKVTDGKLDYWADRTTRTLTYAVDKRSFSAAQYNTVVKAFARAASDWEAACPDCGLKFIHNAAEDVAPVEGHSTFIVVGHNANGSYFALSFFPSDSIDRRYVLVDPSYFTTQFDRAGIFRHELGHILGYMHEQIRGVAGCYQDAGQWQALSAYDPHSVMHYFCGGGGTFSLALSDTDRDSHQKLYQ